MKSLLRVFAVLFAAVMLAAPLAQAQRERLPPDDLEYVNKKWPNAKKTATSIRYIVEKEGTGEPAKSGNEVSVRYTGMLLDGTVFDSTEAADREPLKFRVNRGAVIQGWDQILQQMKLGEKRTVIIPPELAYGTRGSPPKIGRDATLVFVMELVEIKRD